MIITDKERSIITEIMNLPLECSSMEDYLPLFYDKIFVLMGCEYAGIATIQDRVMDRITLDNNPEEFNQLYFSKLMEMDPLFMRLVEDPHKIHGYHMAGLVKDDNREFFYECDKIRPTGDYGYVPIHYKKHLIGLMGFCFPPGRKYFNDKSIRLMEMILPSFYYGLDKFSQESKVSLMNQGLGRGKFCSFYIWSNGEVEFPEHCKKDIIALVLELDNVDEKSIVSHSVIKMLLTADYSRESISLFRGGKYWNLKSITQNPFLQLKMHIVTIEEDIPVYNYKAFAHRWNLTPRESEILPYITLGASNKIISENLFISISTVKRHISNIYGKTGVQNRSQLILGLSLL